MHKFYKRFNEIVRECERTFRKKNHDYSGSDPYSSFRDFGWKGVIVRIGDKYHRAKNFALKEKLKVQDKKLVDTLKDLAVYSIITVILFEEGIEGNTPNERFQRSNARHRDKPPEG